MLGTWIERGSDGRAYFVRHKRAKRPSVLQLLADALIPEQTPSSPFSRSSQPGCCTFSAPVKAPLFLPAPLPVRSAPPAATSFHLNPDSNTFKTANMNPHNQPVQRQDTGNSARGMTRPALPAAYAAPFPGIYPLPAVPQPAGQWLPMHAHPGPPYLPQQIHPAAQVPALRPPYPTPPTAVSQRPPPPGVAMLGPQHLPTTDEMRYKCSVCGRFRSTRYHYRHPIPPGQLPSKTVCGRCWDEATASEDSETADDTQERGYREVSPMGRLSRSASTRAARSRSTVKYSDEDEYDYYQSRRGRAWSRSGSPEISPVRRSSRRAISRRARSRSVGNAGAHGEDGETRLVRRVTYIEELPARTKGHGHRHQYSETYHVRGSLTPGPDRQVDALNRIAPHQPSVDEPWSRNVRPETGLTSLKKKYRSVASSRLSDSDFQNNFHNEDASSSSPSVSRSDRASRTFRQGGPVEAIDHLTLDRSDDYDYHDKDGMRITVREI
ncbi:hypothetical protein DV738_g79, partial [Chaetothyriales sp. CBS 135597]